MRESRSFSQDCGKLSKYAIGLLILFFMLVLSMLIINKPLSASVPDSCIGTKAEWEAEIDRLEKNLSESRNAHADGNRRSGGLPSGRYPRTGDPIMDVLTREDFHKLSARQQADAMAAAVMGDIQYRTDPLRRPHQPGANSLLQNQRFAKEISDIRAYIGRCFPAEEEEKTDNEETADDNVQASDLEMPCRPSFNPIRFMQCDEPTHAGVCY